MDTPHPMDTTAGGPPPRPARPDLRSLAPRRVDNVLDLRGELHRIYPRAGDAWGAVPAVESGADGDPFVVDGITLGGLLRSTELETYVDQAEADRVRLEELEVAVRWALVDLRGKGTPNLALLEARLDKAYNRGRAEGDDDLPRPE